MMRALFVIALCLFAGLGCSRQSVAVRSAPPSAYPNATYGWPPPSTGAQPDAPPPQQSMLAGPGAPEIEPVGHSEPDESEEPSPTITMPNVPRMSTRDIPEGSACLKALDAAGIKYKRIEEKRGMETPIEVTGDLGGIKYSGVGQHLICDCRLALALHKVGPTLRELGVTAMHFSGAYSYRMSRVGKLSLHAYGHAVDVHEATVNGLRVSVKENFARGLGDACAFKSPALNQIACRLKATGLFRELLTPDYNADHADHFHIGLAPLRTDPPAKPIETPTRVADASKPATKSKSGAKPIVLPELDPVDPASGEPIVIPPLDEAPATKSKSKSKSKEHKPEKASKKHRDNARSKSPPKRSGSLVRLTSARARHSSAKRNAAPKSAR